jgi:hypothetical protein
MSWTRLNVEIDVDGERDDAETHVDEMFELLLDNGNVIAVSAHWGKTHADTCDDTPCTCGARE